MGVDLLRVCYAANVTFHRGSNQTARIRWYKVPSDRELLPYQTLFSSWVWDKENGLDPSEVQGTYLQGEALDGDRPYRNGARLTAVDPYTPGRGPCGTEAQWGGDLVYGRDEALLPDVNGNPACCTGLPTAIFIRPAGFGVQNIPPLGSVLNMTGANSADFFPLESPEYLAVHGVERIFFVLPPPPHTVSFPLSWKLEFPVIPGTIKITLTGEDGAGNPLTWTYEGVTSGHTVPLPVATSDLPGSATDNSTVEIPGYAPVEDADMLIGAIVWDAAGGAIPPRYLLCDGSPYNTADYPALFARIGNTFNLGDPPGVFRVPDLMDRVVIGSGSLYALGAHGGSSFVILGVNNLPGHTHTFTSAPQQHGTGLAAGTQYVVFDPASVQYLAFGGPGNMPFVTPAVTGPAVVTGTTDATGSGFPFDILPPYVALRPLIYAGV